MHSKIKTKERMHVLRARTNFIVVVAPWRKREPMPQTQENLSVRLFWLKFVYRFCYKIIYTNWILNKVNKFI